MYWTTANIITEIIYYAPWFVLFFYLIFNEYLTPQSVGWLILAWFHPWIGILIYIAFNMQPRRFIPKWTIQDQRNTQPSPPKALLPSHWTFLNKVGESVNQMPYTFSHDIDVLENIQETLNQMIQSIHQAKHSIYLTTYIYKSDIMGMALIQSLKQAQDRGIKIYLLFDSYGSLLFLPFTSSRKKLKKAGLSYQLFLPMKDWRFWVLFNIRMHAKILVIDHTVAYVGSMNIRYFDLKKQPFNQRELTFKIQGPVIDQLIWVSRHFLHISSHTNPHTNLKDTQQQESQNHDIHHVYEPNKSLQQTFPSRILYRDVDFASSSVDILMSSVVDQAQSSIYLWTPYFIPPLSFRQALRKASARGVKISILIPGRLNILLKSAALLVAEEMISYGISVFVAEHIFDHKKIMIVDDLWVSGGSINFDSRSFLINCESNFEVFSKPLATKLKHHFYEQVSLATQLPSKYKTKTMYRFLGNLVLLISPIF